MKVDANIRKQIREQIAIDKAWLDGNSHHSTIKTKPQQLLNYIEIITLLLDDLDSASL